MTTAQVKSVWVETIIRSIPPAQVKSVWVETLIVPKPGGWAVGLIRMGN